MGRYRRRVRDRPARPQSRGATQAEASVRSSNIGPFQRGEAGGGGDDRATSGRLVDDNKTELPEVLLFNAPAKRR
jgi:hypothetical protein